MIDMPIWTSGAYVPGTKRYRVGARWFHWITALLMFAVVPLGWIFAEFKKTVGERGIYTSAHKTIGLLILVLVVARLAYRVANKPPRLPDGVNTFEAGLAHATHWLIYLILLVMPISGYIMSSGSKYPISIAGLFDFPKLPVSAAMAASAKQVHLVAQYAVYGLVILHVAAVCWHLFVRRDDILARMLPRQANVE